jgi:Cu(I)/Ag(I) efflux system membrane fusion protein
MKHKIIYSIFILSLVFAYSCNTNSESKHSEHNMGEMAGMDAIVYTCPMHPEIIKDKPGNCPICGMALVKKGEGATVNSEDTLNFILQPANETVLSKIPVIKLEQKTIEPEFNYQGFTSIIPQNSNFVSARITGRIESVFVKYNYQKVNKGQKLFTIYSPELLTGQNNLIFLMKQDASNLTLIEASKNKLKLLGFSELELKEIIKSNKPLMAVSVFSNYDGFIYESSASTSNDNFSMGMAKSNQSSLLSIKEGSYLQKGQVAFSIIDNSKLWLLLSIPESDLKLISVGNKLRFKPEVSAGNDYRAEINYIEPLLNEEKKTITARVIIDNSSIHLPIQTQVNATVFGNSYTGDWLPSSAIIDLGKQKAVLVKSKMGFKVQIVKTALRYESLIQIIAGVKNTDEIAVNAQYLMDSESFIKQSDK